MVSAHETTIKMPDNLFDRIKQAVSNFSAKMPAQKRPQPETPQEQTPEEASVGYIPRAQMINAVVMAARNQRLLYIRYNDKWRHIEPYEFQSGDKGSMIYAWCLLDGDIHSFYVFKIQEMYLTEIPYIARFPIKI